jgi:hypothetical protein
MNLRGMIDGAGSLQLNLPPVVSKDVFTPNTDVIIRRKSNRSGPTTSEVIVGRILAVGEHTADVSVPKQGGITQKVTISLNDLSPVTDSFKRQSIQFNQAFRPRI